MTQLTKQCWSCDATTDYEIGWCPDCQFIIDNNENLEALFHLSFVGADKLPEPLAGGVRAALADYIRAKRRPPQQARPKIETTDGKELLSLLGLGGPVTKT